MRVSVPGVSRHPTPVTFDYEGQAVDAAQGETVAAALLNAGRGVFREDNKGHRRGLFCGMGVCWDCGVLVDGVPRRACMEPVRAGAHVKRLTARTQAPPVSQPTTGTAPSSSALWVVRSPDILVVGAGPAGLSAARDAAAAGLDVLVVDERAKAGGQYFKQPGDGFDVREDVLDAQFREGRGLARDAARAGAEFLFGATLWGAFTDLELGVATDRETLLIRPKRLILSPGAYERPLPVPGWTLPGVMTTGAVQTLLRAYQTAPGRRVLIAGNGPLNLQVARELTDAGVKVVAVAELTARPGLAAASALLGMAGSSPSLALQGAGHLARLAMRRVPVLYRHVLLRVDGNDHARRVTIGRIAPDGSLVPGSEKSWDIDTVAMGYGFLPQSELARALGCRHSYDPKRRCLVVDRDDSGRTSDERIFICGDAGGLGGARIAAAQGSLSALAAAEDLKGGLTPGETKHRRTALRSLARHRRFQTGLWRFYDAPVPDVGLATADTLICRCECVDRAAIETTMAEGNCSLAAVKRATRAGMGRCQGRYCGPAMAAMLQDMYGGEPAEEAFFAPRTPFKPMPIGKLAGDIPGAPHRRGAV